MFQSPGMLALWRVLFYSLMCAQWYRGHIAHYVVDYPPEAGARLGADAFLDHLVRCDTRAADAKPTNHARPLLHECDNRGVSPLDIMVARYRVSRVKAKFLLDAPFDLPSFGLAISFPKFWESGAPPKA